MIECSVTSAGDAAEVYVEAQRQDHVLRRAYNAILELQVFLVREFR